MNFLFSSFFQFFFSLYCVGCLWETKGVAAVDNNGMLLICAWFATFGHWFDFVKLKILIEMNLRNHQLLLGSGKTSQMAKVDTRNRLRLKRVKFLFWTCIFVEGRKENESIRMVLLFAGTVPIDSIGRLRVANYRRQWMTFVQCSCRTSWFIWTENHVIIRVKLRSSVRFTLSYWQLKPSVSDHILCSLHIANEPSSEMSGLIWFYWLWKSPLMTEESKGILRT